MLQWFPGFASKNYGAHNPCLKRRGMFGMVYQDVPCAGSASVVPPLGYDVYTHVFIHPSPILRLNSSFLMECQDSCVNLAGPAKKLSGAFSCSAKIDTRIYHTGFLEVEASC